MDLLISVDAICLAPQGCGFKGLDCWWLESRTLINSGINAIVDDDKV